MTKARPFTQMVVFGIGDDYGSLVSRSGRGDPQGITLLPFFVHPSGTKMYHDLRASTTRAG